MWPFTRRKPSNRAKGPVGSVGVVTVDGTYVPVDPLPELTPPAGLGKYRKMYYNDPVVGGLMWHIRAIIAGLEWRIEGDGPEWADKWWRPWGSLGGVVWDMTSALIYGFWVGEAVLTGALEVVDLEPRLQTTIYQFTRDAIYQTSPAGSAVIPRTKCVLFVPMTEGRSPWGVPLLRHAYKPWWNKSRIEASELMGIDRDVGGLPVMSAPEGFDFSATTPGSPNYSEEAAQALAWAREVVTSMRRDRLRGLVKPSDWTLELLRGGSGDVRSVEEPIQRYNTEICVALLQTFAALGTFAGRAGARVASFVDLFLGGCDWLAGMVKGVLERELFERWCGLWGQPVPKVGCNRAKEVNMKDLASYVARLVSQGVITPTKELEEALLGLVDLPVGEEEKDA